MAKMKSLHSAVDALQALEGLHKSRAESSIPTAHRQTAEAHQATRKHTTCLYSNKTDTTFHSTTTGKLASSEYKERKNGGLHKTMGAKTATKPRTTCHRRVGFPRRNLARLRVAQTRGWRRTNAHTPAAVKARPKAGQLCRWRARWGAAFSPAEHSPAQAVALLESRPLPRKKNVRLPPYFLYRFLDGRGGALERRRRRANKQTHGGDLAALVSKSERADPAARRLFQGTRIEAAFASAAAARVSSFSIPATSAARRANRVM